MRPFETNRLTRSCPFAMMQRMDDRTLVRRCIDRDPQGWREFHARFHPLLRHTAVTVLGLRDRRGEDADVEDICAAVYRSLLERDCARLRSFRWECPLSRWLVRLARSRTIDFLRSRPRGQEPLDPQTPLPSSKEESPVAADRVAEAFEKLPERDRTLLSAYYLEDRSYREIAAEFKTTENVLGVWLGRARRKLRELLDSKKFPSFLL